MTRNTLLQQRMFLEFCVNMSLHDIARFHDFMARRYARYELEEFHQFPSDKLQDMYFKYTKHLIDVLNLRSETHPTKAQIEQEAYC